MLFRMLYALCHTLQFEMCLVCVVCVVCVVCCVCCVLCEVYVCACMRVCCVCISKRKTVCVWECGLFFLHVRTFWLGCVGEEKMVPGLPLLVMRSQQIC